ncbi:MAG: sulfurtransferase [Rhodothermaceae bacterium]|mgnify:CR=1 FL=1|nr:sulfurtransferase [Rhodothermaceae bacterium]MBC14461.1 sulfurtransferase [Rhodothermaceae bacterium]
MRLLRPLVLLAVAVGAVVWLRSDRAYRPDSLAWRAVDRDLAARFPDLPSTTTAALADRLDAPDPPLLLDARTEAEFAVSHLPGARHVDPDAEAGALAAALANVDPEREIVVYCSVGVRSATVTARLREAGFAHVENLRGSIFEWANEGRPVVRDGREVEAVHPYDAVWGRLLAPERRADLP